MAGAGFAQQRADDIVTLPGVSVDAARLPVARALRETRQVPGGAGVVDAAALRGGRLNSPADLFSLQPGVLVMTAFGGIDHPRLSIRGASIQRGGDPSAGRGILFLQDGFPVNFSDGSYDFVEFLDPAGIDHATILRGGNALTLGATALGGAVDLVSPAGRDASGGLVRGEAGGHGYARGQLSLSGDGKGRDFHFDATGFALDGWREYSRQEASRARLNFGIDLGRGWSNRVFLSAMHSRVEVTGVQTLAQIDAGDTAALPIAIMAQIGRDSSQYRFGDRVTGPLAGGTLSAGAGVAYVDFTFAQGGNVTRSRNTDASLDAKWTRRGEVFGGLANTLTLGARAQIGRRDQQVFLNGSGVAPNLGGVRGLMHSDNRLTAENGTLWIDNHLGLGRGFTLVATAAVTRANRINEDRFTAIRAGRPDSSGSVGTAAFLPRLALVYECKDVQFFANITRGFEPLTWDALLTTRGGTGSGEALINGSDPRRAVATSHSPQRAITVEAGMRARTRRVAWELTAYRSWVSKELLLLATDASGVATRFGNADRTIHQGVEAAAGVDLLQTAAHSLIARASYTWSDFYFDGDPVWRNNTLPVIPPHFAQFALRYHHARGWYGGATLTWQPRGGWADYANTLRAPGYATLDLRAGYAPAKGIGFFLDLRNVLGRRHVTGINAGAGNLGGMDAARFFPGEPRTLYGGAEFRW
ncbi:iron complex outermembrane receptor protein [Ereboglobus sp. PH5-5]|uniref:TonB-dependent receptor family protein n=1 Tax=unclassified Ereboglobus TaxID=2626932 RepID=UPI00240610F2|nr:MULTISPECIES: TonB-dependent receptor [unclassified Ereboglobus]MDF9827287.1 iron complex outermembrane receptor protein [Ereboglobus sp. PH5-10]MDF9833764.1 iron complex outermembrane receptor protein [Ereboglobus sp. PH5-5]